MLLLLARHPWFRVAYLTASDRSAGRTYQDAVDWVQETPIPRKMAEMRVERTPTPSAPGLAESLAGRAPLALSALDASVAGGAEAELASAGVMVVSNARSHRMDPTVPLLIPEVNPEHLALLDWQKWAPGGIITNPNCSTIGLALTLKPLDDAFGLRRVTVVTLQALSGAGLPGVPAMQIVDNVIPHIAGEEEKLERETLKILGRLDGKGIAPADLAVSAQCTRVPVLDGHLCCVSVGLERNAGPEEAAEVLASFRGADGVGDLPSAPARPIHVLEEEDAPQPRLHRNREGGMAVSVGRVRPCPVLGLRYVLLSHNTVRGAAGGAILAAELALARERLPPRSPEPSRREKTP